MERGHPVAGDNLTINGICIVDNNVLTNNVAYGSLTVGNASNGTLKWAAGGTNILKCTDFTSAFAGSTLDMTNGGKLTITSVIGSITNFICGTGTIERQLNGANMASFTIYNNLIINSPGGTITTGINTVINGNLTITAGTTLTWGGFDLTVGGTTTVGGTISLTSTTGTKTFNNLLISGTFTNNSVNEPFNVSGDFQNNGTFTSGTGRVTFTGAASNTITGISTSAFGGGITINKGVSNANILDVQSLITISAGGLTLTNGTFKLTSASTITPFTADITAGNFLIPSTAGLWNNGGTINSSNMNWTVAGILRESNGTMNIGTVADNVLIPKVTASIMVDGGNLNLSSRISNPGIAWSFFMTGGILTVNTAGSTAAGIPPFNMDVAGGSFNMSSGTILIQNAGGTAGQNLGYRNLATGGSGFTGGTLQIGNLATAASQTIGITSTNPIYDLSVNSANATAQLQTSALTVTHNLTLAAVGGALQANGQNLTVGNNWRNNVSTTAFTGGATTVTMTGTAGGFITGTSATTFNNLTISAPGQSVTCNIAASVSGDLTVSAGTFDLGIFTADRSVAGGTLTVSNGASLKIGGTNTLPSNYTTHSIGATSTIEYSGTTQSVATLNSAQDYGHLIISGSGTKTLAGTENVAGNLTISAGTFDLGSNTINRTSAGGTLTLSNGAALKIGGTNTFPSNYSAHSIGVTSTIEYSGTNQSLAFLNSAQDYGNLTISGGGTKTLAASVNVIGTLTFTLGTITTGASIIYVKSTGTVSRTSGHVIGNFKKYIATGATSKTFETGDVTNYTPVTVAFASVTTAGDLTASVTATDHPNLAGSGIRTDKSVNRYFTLTNTGIAFTTASLTMNWIAGDVDAGSTTANFSVGNYNNPTWTLPSFASPLATSIQATGISSFGDFAAGERCILSSAFSYTASPYCSNGGTATPTITGTAGTFTSTAGLSINSVTGVVNLAASTAGAYVVTNSATSAGGCASSSTANITITALPSATISYAGAPFCSNAGVGSVTRTGTGGGTYTASPAGLTINAATGAITPGTSTAGTYTVTYTMAAAGGCSQQTATTSVTITALPVATISYAGTPFCTSAGIGSVTLTGTGGGTYSSIAGLSVNAATGAITPGTSTAGTYTVTYTMAAAGGCSQQTATTSVTITALPAATIAYAGTPFCTSAGVGSVTQTGTSGGTYTSTAGLTINAGTGAITPGTSTPNTYTVTYTVTASGGCSIYTTTTSVTVSAPLSATISYAGTPYCSSGGTATVTRTGAAGGTYTSTGRIDY